MENRIKKLFHQEERLKRQIVVALNHTQFSDEVSNRRRSVKVIRQKHKDYWEDVKSKKHKVAVKDREENISKVNWGHHQVQRSNMEICEEKRQKSLQYDASIRHLKVEELRKKQSNVDEKYNNRKLIIEKMHQDRELYLDSVARIH